MLAPQPDPPAPPAPAVATLGLRELRPDDVRHLGEGLALVFDAVLGEARALELARVLCVADDARLVPAAVGRGDERRVEPALRGDRTRWLERARDEPLASLWDLFDRLGRELTERAWLGVRDFEVQLACYPGAGARYAPHRDGFAGGGRRRATGTYYLNADWRDGDGGQLRIHREQGSLDVEPRLDRLVLFLPGVLHEVLPAATARWAVTAFFLGPPRR